MTTPGRLPADNSWTSPSAETGPRPAVPVPAEAAYITARQYCDRLGGVSFTSLARYIKADKEFPRPIYFANRIRFFKVSDILAYERKCEIKAATKAAIKAADND